MEQKKQRGKNKSGKLGVKERLVLAMLPVTILTYLLVCMINYQNTKQSLTENLNQQIVLISENVGNQLEADLKQTKGIMDNVKVSMERDCKNAEEMGTYIYNIGDAYPETIPTGIYCGFTDGTYVDKMWTPDADWVLADRPWYQAGLKADEVTFGESYQDADTGQFINSIYTNIKDKNGTVMGVVSADIPLDNLNQILRDQTILSNGYIYAIDRSSGLIFGNKQQDDWNGQSVFELQEEGGKKISEMLQQGDFQKLEKYQSQYIYLQEIQNTNYITISVVPETDVISQLISVRNKSIASSVAGIVIQIIIMLLFMGHFLKPIGKINGLMNNMQGLDFTERIVSKGSDELAQIATNLNKLAGQLCGVIQNFKTSLEQVQGQADINVDVADKLNHSAETQRESLEELVETMNALSDSLQSVAEGAVKLGDTVTETSGAAKVVEEKIETTRGCVEYGKQNVQSMTSMMENISAVSRELQEAVNNVKDGLEGINQMVTVITDIADQTDLLSLNASIEAARAGEHGKGFAIVADEIRTLAESCASSAIDIVNTTKDMDQMVYVVLQKTEESISAIEEGNNVVVHTDETFQSIFNNMKDIETAMDQVDEAMQSMELVAKDMETVTNEQNHHSDEVLSACRQAMDISKEFNQQGETMVQVGSELKGLSTTLMEQIEQFKLGEDA